MSTATMVKSGSVNSVPASDDEVRRSIEEEGNALVQEEAIKDDVVSERLFGAAKEVTEEIEQCTKVIEKAEADCKKAVETAEAARAAAVQEAVARRGELQQQFQAALNKMQSTYGVQPKTQRKQKPVVGHKKRGRPANNGKQGKSIRLLITEYLEKHRQAKTSEIRTFLQSQGRTTNPGVELSRMVKDGSILNKERGMYAVGKPRK